MYCQPKMRQNTKRDPNEVPTRSLILYERVWFILTESPTPVYTFFSGHVRYKCCCKFCNFNNYYFKKYLWCKIFIWNTNSSNLLVTFMWKYVKGTNKLKIHSIVMATFKELLNNCPEKIFRDKSIFWFHLELAFCIKYFFKGCHSFGIDLNNNLCQDTYFHICYVV